MGWDGMMGWNGPLWMGRRKDGGGMEGPNFGWGTRRDGEKGWRMRRRWEMRWRGGRKDTGQCGGCGEGRGRMDVRPREAWRGGSSGDAGKEDGGAVRGSGWGRAGPPPAAQMTPLPGCAGRRRAWAAAAEESDSGGGSGRGTGSGPWPRSGPMEQVGAGRTGRGEAGRGGAGRGGAAPRGRTGTGTGSLSSVRCPTASLPRHSHRLCSGPPPQAARVPAPLTASLPRQRPAPRVGSRCRGGSAPLA